MKNILLAVLGETPQILTETIWSFYFNRPNFTFNQITVLTTSLGFQKIKEKIFERNLLNQLAADLNRPLQDFPFTTQDIIVFKNHTGQELEDVRTDQEIQIATKQFYSLLQSLTADDQTAIIATIAGGRKNMGAALALGLQLFGRPQDQLIHVLVKRQHESSDWFYPQSPEEYDHIEISSIPYIRIRNYLPTKNFFNLSPEELLNLAQQSLDTNAPIQQLEIRDNIFIIDGNRIKLPPQQAIILRFLARQKTEHCLYPERLECSNCSDCFVDIKRTLYTFCNSNAYLEEYKHLASGAGFVERRKEIGEIRAEDLRALISKIRKNLQKLLPNFRLQQNFQILSVPDPNEKDKRFHLIGLSVNKSAIKWDDSYHKNN